MKPFTLLGLFASLLCAQPYSKQYLTVKQYTQAENEAIVAKFKDLRVTDVVDGLDVAGLQDMTIMDQAIRPMWRDGEKFTHRIYGVAVTLRIVPPQERAPNFPNHDDFAKSRLVTSFSVLSCMLIAPSLGSQPVAEDCTSA